MTLHPGGPALDPVRLRALANNACAVVHTELSLVRDVPSAAGGALRRYASSAREIDERLASTLTRLPLTTVDRRAITAISAQLRALAVIDGELVRASAPRLKLLRKQLTIALASVTAAADAAGVPGCAP